jgi:hypothetical protein
MYNPDCPDCTTNVCTTNDFTYEVVENPIIEKGHVASTSLYVFMASYHLHPSRTFKKKEKKKKNSRFWE